jgi:hypothetical protein
MIAPFWGRNSAAKKHLQLGEPLGLCDEIGLAVLLAEPFVARSFMTGAAGRGAPPDSFRLDKYQVAVSVANQSSAFGG